MSESTSQDSIPGPLRRFIDRGDSVFRCEDGDWDVEIEHPPPKFLLDVLPDDAVIIANNGCGDYLFLRNEGDSTASTYPVFVFWHEGAQIEEFSNNLTELTDPPEPVPSDHPEVFYSDGSTQILIGDHVSARDILFRKDGRIVYVPGISKRNWEFEHGGLTWVGIRFESGSVTGIFVDPDSKLIKKSVRFISRSKSDIEEIGPYEDLE
jgi:hypothetical protein